MPNFTKTEDELETNFDKWLYVIKNLHRIDNIPDRLKTKLFEKLFKTASYSALSKTDRDKYEESLKYYNDLKNSLDTAFDNGKEEALLEMLPIIEEERKQKEEAQQRELEERKQKEEERKQKESKEQTIINLIKKLHQKGFSISEIAEDTGKSEAEIKQIIQGK